MTICELSDYKLAPEGSGNGFNKICFALSAGDVCSIKTDSAADARLFLRALATLTKPVEGKYYFNGVPLDFSDYRNLLPVKRKIGYIASDSGVISNRTLRENIFLTSYYFEDSIPFELKERTKKLCRHFKIEKKLDFPSAELNQLDLRIAITIRELIKSPEFLILERPEDFMEYHKYHIFIDILNRFMMEGIPIVFFSYDLNFIHKFSKKTILITDGSLTTVPKAT